MGRPSRRFSAASTGPRRRKKREVREWDAGREDARDAVACCVLPFNAGVAGKSGDPMPSLSRHRGRFGGQSRPACIPSHLPTSSLPACLLLKHVLPFTFISLGRFVIPGWRGIRMAGKRDQLLSDRSDGIRGR